MSTGIQSTSLIYDVTLDLTFAPPNTAPVVTITEPAAPPTVDEGVSVDFVATSIDTEDGDISAGIVWTSDLDGLLFTGASFSTVGLSVGVHLITATSTDSGALVGLDTVVVTVVEVEGAIGPFSAKLQDPRAQGGRDDQDLGSKVMTDEAKGSRQSDVGAKLAAESSRGKVGAGATPSAQRGSDSAGGALETDVSASSENQAAKGSLAQSTAGGKLADKSPTGSTSSDNPRGSFK